MKKMVIALVSLAVLAVCAGIAFQCWQSSRPYPVYTGIVDFLKTKYIPSSAQIINATFQGDGNTCWIIVRMKYERKHGGYEKSRFVAEFTGKGVDRGEPEDVREEQLSRMKEVQKKIDDGLVLDPFACVRLKKAVFNEKTLDDAELQEVESAIARASAQGGRELATGGRVRKLSPDGNHVFSSFHQTYIPGKLFAYQD